MTDINIPDSVIAIGRRAFRSCASLSKVTLSNQLKSIGYFAFSHCTNLTAIEYKGTVEEAIHLGIGRKDNGSWRLGSPIQTIICTDGEINLLD